MSIYSDDNWHAFLRDTFGWKINHLVIDNQHIPFVIKRKLDLKKIASSLPLVHRMPDLVLRNREAFVEELSKHDIGDFNYHGYIDAPFFSRYSINVIVKLNLKAYVSASEIFSNFSKDSIQRKVNKAVKSGFKVEHLHQLRNFEDFQEIQSETRKRQGSPTYPKNFFTNLKKHLGESVNLFGIYDNRQLISGIITFNYGGNAIYAYGASTSKDAYLKQGINQQCMWESIKFAKEGNCSVYDFGSTPNHHKSLLEYKLKWSNEKEDLFYSFFSISGKQIPVLDRQSGMAKLMEKVIHKMPDQVFKSVTPHLLKLAVY
jgi:lipid II:glycine glycyltransferase (peptidoglycan interpeptide bridge formation enzyme)